MSTSSFVASSVAPSVTVTTPAGRRPPGSLTRDEVVEVASALIGSDGLASFSMRKLAAALGVNPMTIYLRFENKDELLEAVVGAELGDIVVAGDGGSWVDQVVQLGQSIRRHLIRRRELLPLLASSSDQLDRAMLDATDAGLRLMRQAGFEGPAAVEAFRALFWHAVGFAMTNDTIVAGRADRLRDARARLAADDISDSHPDLEALIDHFDQPDPDRVFEVATRALADGLAARTHDGHMRGRTPV